MKTLTRETGNYQTRQPVLKQKEPIGGSCKRDTDTRHIAADTIRRCIAWPTID